MMCGIPRADGGEPRDDRPVVLVVDDEAPVAQTAEIWLDDCEVRVATSGEEALDLYDPAVDVVLVDRRMPGMAGDEVLERLAERGGDPGVGILSAVDPDVDVVDLPFDLYVQKPVDEALLADAVDVLLERAGAAGRDRELLRMHATLAALRGGTASHESHDQYEALEATFERLREETGTDPESDEWTDVEQFATGFGE